jgi:hypothetical protein
MAKHRFWVGQSPGTGILQCFAATKNPSAATSCGLFRADSFDDAAFGNATIARYLKSKNASLDHAVAIKKGWFAFDQAKQKDDFFIAKKMNAKTYKIFFDADGSGAKSALEIATVTYDKKIGGDISYKDFFFV